LGAKGYQAAGAITFWARPGRAEIITQSASFRATHETYFQPSA